LLISSGKIRGGEPGKTVGKTMGEYLTQEQIMWLVPENLRVMRKKYTLKELADMCGVSETVIRRRCTEYNIGRKRVRGNHKIGRGGND